MKSLDLCSNPANFRNSRETAAMQVKPVSSNKQRAAPRPLQPIVGLLSRATNSAVNSNSASAMPKTAPSKRLFQTHLWPLIAAMAFFLGPRQPAGLVGPPRRLNSKTSSWDSKWWCKVMAMVRQLRGQQESMPPISLTRLCLVACHSAMRIRRTSSRWQIWSFRKKTIRMQFAIARSIWTAAILTALANISFSWTKTPMGTFRWTIHTLIMEIVINSKYSTGLWKMSNRRTRKMVESYCSIRTGKVWPRALKLVRAPQVPQTTAITMAHRAWVIWAPPENNKLAITHRSQRAVHARKRIDLGGEVLGKLKR